MSIIANHWSEDGMKLKQLIPSLTKSRENECTHDSSPALFYSQYNSGSIQVGVITGHQNNNDRKCIDLQNSKYPQDGETNGLLEECYSHVSSLNFFGYLRWGHRWESSIFTSSLNRHSYGVLCYFSYSPWIYDHARQVCDSKRKSHKSSKECPLIEFL